MKHLLTLILFATFVSCCFVDGGSQKPKGSAIKGCAVDTVYEIVAPCSIKSRINKLKTPKELLSLYHRLGRKDLGATEEILHLSELKYANSKIDSICQYWIKRLNADDFIHRNKSLNLNSPLEISTIKIAVHRNDSTKLDVSIRLVEESKARIQDFQSWEILRGYFAKGKYVFLVLTDEDSKSIFYSTGKTPQDVSVRYAMSKPMDDYFMAIRTEDTGVDFVISKSNN